MEAIEIVIAGAGVVAAPGLALQGVDEAGVLRGTDDAALKAHIGRRGIRYKDRATRLALAAARVAMVEAGLGGTTGYQDLDDHRCAVVVACCFGNVDTVLRCAAQIRAEGAVSLSPMDLPNASANVIPATLAIWFGLRGANLLCGGGGSGQDALLFASNLIRAGRADRVLVCGVEACQPALAPLFEAAGRGGELPVDIGAALLLERAACYRDRGAGGAACALPEASGVEAGAVFAGTHGAEGVLAVIAARDSLRAHHAVRAGAGA